jgi:hypothetical protein
VHGADTPVQGQRSGTMAVKQLLESPALERDAPVRDALGYAEAAEVVRLVYI